MFRAKVLHPEIDYDSGRVIAKFKILEGNYREWFDVADRDKDYDLTVKRHRDKRSLDANSYYHVLVNKIATAIGSSWIEVKNATLGRYGQLETNEDGRTVEVCCPDSWEVEKREDIHLQPTAQIEFVHGQLYRWYRVIRGSHTYNTAEMSRLIEGTIQDARDAGIPDAEIMTPRERDELWHKYGVIA